MRLYQLHRVALVDLLAQIAHIDVDHVASGLAGKIVDVVVNLGARDHLAAPHREVLEKAILARRKRNRPAAATNGPCRRVELEIADPNDVGGCPVAAPKDRAQPRQQLVEGKWLGQVIVSAEIEPGDPIRDLVARREHENTCRRPTLAQTAKDR